MYNSDSRMRYRGGHSSCYKNTSIKDLGLDGTTLVHLNKPFCVCMGQLKRYPEYKMSIYSPKEIVTTRRTLDGVARTACGVRAEPVSRSNSMVHIILSRLYDLQLPEKDIDLCQRS